MKKITAASRLLVTHRPKSVLIKDFSDIFVLQTGSLFGCSYAASFTEQGWSDILRPDMHSNQMLSLCLYRHKAVMLGKRSSPAGDDVDIRSSWKQAE